MVAVLAFIFLLPIVLPILVLALPILAGIGAVMALAPAWLADAIVLPLVIAAFIGVPVYVIGGAIHAFCTAGRDLRRGIAEAEAHHRAILAKHAALHGELPPVRRSRLGEAGPA